MKINWEEPLAMAVVEAIQGGNLDALQQLLDENPELAKARLVEAGGGSRTLLHVATDWSGHSPNAAAVVTVLIQNGAEVNARCTGRHTETPLHWAASTDDVAVLDVLFDGGADMEADGAVIGGGTPLADAVAFGQWQAAQRLVALGARTTLWQAAALGLMGRVEGYFTNENSPPHDEITNAFWCACHGRQRDAAAYLLAHGAELNWVGHDRLTPLDAARRSGASDVVEWLRTERGRTASELA